jgi:DNA-binding response OmpR family regulator
MSDGLRAEIADMPPDEAVEHLLFIIDGLTGAPEPRVDGLTQLQSRIVRRLEAAKGAVVPAEALLFAAYHDRPVEDWPESFIVQVSIAHIRKRRPDLKIETCHGCGYRLKTGD